ncbi:Cof-type HAD-IIB family hydrolase [Eubacteriales bacterium OttesenSCG-928-N13]|nr:Cof-type HAD-IIB family hydrolase [Eubacteriales bacterium OttesenSCG-928-N13]
MIRMIVTDLDDTLLRTDKTVSKATFDTFEACRQKGIKLVFATARGVSASKLVPLSMFDGWSIMNGAAAFADGQQVYACPIPPDAARPMLLALTERGVKVTAEVGDWHWPNFDMLHYWGDGMRFTQTDYVGFDKHADKLCIWLENPEQQLPIAQALLPEGLHMHVTKDDLGMVMHEEATKSRAVLAIAAHWGIPPEQIVAFGDDSNDVDLLQVCGTGVAMANALDDVKQAADETTLSCDQDGVAHWLQTHILH